MNVAPEGSTLRGSRWGGSGRGLRHTPATRRGEGAGEPSFRAPSPCSVLPRQRPKSQTRRRRSLRLILWVHFPGPEDRKTRDPSLEHLQSGGSKSRKTLPLLHVSPGPGPCEGRAGRPRRPRCGLRRRPLPPASVQRREGRGGGGGGGGGDDRF